MATHTFKKFIEEALCQLKYGGKINIPSKLTTKLSNGRKLECYVITKNLLEKSGTIKLLADWRDKSNKWFPAQFTVTFAGTKKWAIKQLLDKKDRVLFFLQLYGQREPFGHIGLYRFNYEEKSCEIDNVIRGVGDETTKGGMTIGLQLLIDWTLKYLNVQTLYLQVFSDNTKAIKLYKLIGFKEVSKVPLVKKIENGVTKWVEAGRPDSNTFRYFVKMILSKPDL